jgi:hypothetical protein
MMGDPVDKEAEEVANSPPVAPPQGGEQPGSTPAPGDTPAAEPAEPTPEEKAAKQSRAEARAFATLRRENRELYRRLGGLEAMLQQNQQPPAPDGNGVPQQERSLPPAVVKAHDDLNRSIVERIEDAGEEYEAAVEKITTTGYPISTVMRDYLATSKNPAQVAKALADNRDEAQRIYLLGERAADRAMEQLEARVSAPKAAPRTTRALPPPRTVGGSSTARPDPAKMSMDEYAEWRLKRPS